MLTKRHRDERGPTNAGWLRSMHSFSFGHYYDPAHMGFGPLRVINEDWVAPGAGFPTHPHDNMEIITYVLSGELAHKDSLGNGSAIRPGDIQVMSAGSGIRHSEFNNSDSDEVHLLQIWIMPNVSNTAPGYQQKSFDPAELKNDFRVVVSPDGENGSLLIRQDARLLTAKFDADVAKTIAVEQGRKYWLQVATGIVEVNGEEARNGDGVALQNIKEITVVAKTAAEVLLFDLPA